MIIISYRTGLQAGLIHRLYIRRLHTYIYIYFISDITSVSYQKDRQRSRQTEKRINMHKKTVHKLHTHNANTLHVLDNIVSAILIH